MNRFAGMSLRSAVDALFNLKAQAVESATSVRESSTPPGESDYAAARAAEDEFSKAKNEFFQAFDPDQITEV